MPIRATFNRIRSTCPVGLQTGPEIYSSLGTLRPDDCVLTEFLASFGQLLRGKDFWLGRSITVTMVGMVLFEPT